MFKQVRRVLIATVPATVAVLALTAGGASALPRNCVPYLDNINTNYDGYMYWNNAFEADWGIVPENDSIEEATLAGDYYRKYQNALTAAARAGCY